MTQQGVKNSRSPNALSYRQLGRCADLIEANMDFVRKKWGLHKNIYKGTGRDVLHAGFFEANIPCSQFSEKIKML